MNSTPVVVGCGPSAFLLCLYLQKYCFPHKLILSRPLSTGKIGESLLPSIQSHFINLNLPSSPLFHRSFIKRGVNFKTDSTSLPLRFDNAGPFFSYNLDRFDFDSYLLQTYIDRGGEVISAKSFQLHRHGSYSLHVRSDLSHQFDGLIIDATGSPRFSSSFIPTHYSSNLKNKATFFWTTISRSSSNDFSFVDIFLDQNQSWFWHIPIRSLPNSVVSSIGYVSPSSSTSSPDYEKFFSKFDLQPLDSYEDYPSSNKPLHRSDFNYVRDSFFHDNLILCGDSSAFVDPMMSSGVHYCSFSAMTLARILSSRKSSEDINSLLIRYEVECLQEYLSFHQGVSCLYTDELTINNFSFLRRFLNLSSGISHSRSLDPLVSFRSADNNLSLFRDKLFRFAFNLLDSPRSAKLEDIRKVPFF